MKTASKKRMTMLSTLATLAAVVPVTQANAGPMVYGRLDVAVQNVDKDTPGASDVWDVNSYASRLGIKGDEKVTDSLTAIYQYELEIEPEEESIGDSSNSSFLKSRNQFVGLKGGFGQVRLGHMDTPVKTSQGKIDLFSDHTADIKAYLVGENRLGDTINYMTPTFAGGAKFELALLQGEGTTDLDADGTADDSIGDALSASLTYDVDQMYLAIAMDADVSGYDVTRLTGIYKMDGMAFGALYQTAEQNATPLEEQTGFVLSAYFKQGDYKYKIQYGESETESSAGSTVEEQSSISLGVDRKLSDMTKTYLEFTQINEDDRRPASVSDVEITTIALGMQKKF